MRRSVYTESIACPPEEIWAFLADLRNDKAWRHEIKSVEVVSGTPPHAPTVYRETVEWMGRRSVTNLTVSESNPGSHLVVIADGPGFESRSSWRFEPQAEGSIVSLNFSLYTDGALRLTEPLLWDVVDGWLKRDLPLLQGHLSCVWNQQKSPAGSAMRSPTGL